MANTRTAARTAARAPIVTPQARAKADIDYADTVTGEKQRRDELIGLQKDADSYKGLPSALPVIRSNMTRREIADAQQHVNFLNGKGNNQPATGRAVAPDTSGGKSVDDMLSGATPTQRVQANPAGATGGGGGFRGSTPDEIKDFYDSDPVNGTAAKAMAAKLQAAGKTGDAVSTPFGTVSLTDSKLGPGATSLDQVAKKYPAIAQKGTQANDAFAAAYNKAIKEQGPNPDGSAGAAVDPHAIADQVMKNIQNPAKASELSVPDDATIKAPGPLGITDAKIDFGGEQVPVSGATGIKDPGNAAQRTGTAIRDTTGDFGNALAYPFRKAAGVVSDFYDNTVKPFVKGITGDNTPSPRKSAPTVPDASDAYATPPTPVTDKVRAGLTPSAPAAPSPLTPQPLTLQGTAGSGDAFNNVGAPSSAPKPGIVGNSSDTLGVPAGSYGPVSDKDASQATDYSQPAPPSAAPTANAGAPADAKGDVYADLDKFKANPQDDEQKKKATYSDSDSPT